MRCHSHTLMTPKAGQTRSPGSGNNSHSLPHCPKVREEGNTALSLFQKFATLLTPPPSKSSAAAAPELPKDKKRTVM